MTDFGLQAGQKNLKHDLFGLVSDFSQHAFFQEKATKSCSLPKCQTMATEMMFWHTMLNFGTPRSIYCTKVVFLAQKSHF
jgi:hypothetical protein